MAPIDEPAEMSPEQADAAFNEYAKQLRGAIDRDVRPWVRRSIGTYVRIESLPVEAQHAAAAIADQAHSEVLAGLDELFATDLDQQRATPLALLRRAARGPTEFLDSLGIAHCERDDFERLAAPHDVYGLEPKTWSDVSDDVGSAGIAWGAAKAFVHLQRRRGNLS